MHASGKTRLLLHVCCAPCATHSIERLVQDYDLTLFFSDSNISPQAEYEHRLNEARRLAHECGVPLVEDAYDHEAWRRHIRGAEDEPEGSRRCARCFEFNLSRAARYAVDRGFGLFTTTLTVSPHKSSNMVFEAGKRVGPFLAVDLKKRNGFKRSLELSKHYDLYRQDYCGCEFSRRTPHTR